MERFPPFDATLAEIEPVAPGTLVYRYALGEPRPFLPGQFFNVAVPGARPRPERSYSVYSDAADPSRLDFCIKLVPGGAASEMYARARAGDVHALRGPFGHFTLRPDPEDIVFACTGTGIAPFRPMLLDAARRRDPRRMRLYFGVRREEDLFMLGDLERFRADLPDFAAKLCLSQPSPAWTGRRGRVTDALANDYPAPAERFYLCGNPAMIDEVRDILRARGVERQRVHSEKYF